MRHTKAWLYSRKNDSDISRKIGISSAVSSKKRSRFLILIRVLNENRHQISDFTVIKDIKLSSFERYIDAVEIVKQHEYSFIEKAKKLQKHLKNQVLFEVDLQKVDNAINIINKIHIQQTTG